MLGHRRARPDRQRKGKGLEDQGCAGGNVRMRRPVCLFHQLHPRIAKTALSTITSGARTQLRVCDGGDREQAWGSISAAKGDFRPRSSPNVGSM